MARRGHAYPNVRVVAADLVNTTVRSLPSRASVEEGLAQGTRLDVAGYTVGPARSGPACCVVSRTRLDPASCAARRVVLRDDLQRAMALGLGHLPARRLGRALPTVDAATGEVAVRRELAAGVPLVLVCGETEPMRAVAPTGASRAGLLGPSLATRLATVLDGEAHQILRRVALLAEGQGSRAFVVGGVVRDAMAGEARRGAHDLDVVIEGDGLTVARRLADEMGGRIAVHARFLTASVLAPAGRRVDVATARAERYEAPGALPRVRPASIEEDLARRDFTVNAMAAELASGFFHLVDPFGGRLDLARRRLRVLHPLSFVEDPTRLFRAARYAIRLQLTPDPWTAACRRLALGLAPFPALSGARLAAELKLVLSEAHAARVLARLRADRVFHLLARRYRHTALAAARLGGLASALAWGRRHALTVAPTDLLVLVLADGQAPRVAPEVLSRLGGSGVTVERFLAILSQTRARLGRLAAARSRSAAARILRGCPGVELAWLWLTGNPGGRRRLTVFAARDAAVRPWLSGDEVIALGIPRGPAVARVLDELRDGRLDGALRDRAAAAAHVQRRAGAGKRPDGKEG